MSIITATNYEGRLHLGYGDENSGSKCLGNSINVYRNSISKFFANLFNVSIEIDIDGKHRCVNKKSFHKHLQSIGLGGSDVKDVKNAGYETFIQKHANTIIIGNKKLGESFSCEKRTKLFIEMIVHLQLNNTQAVKRLINKGAYIDREFFKPSQGAINGQLFWISRTQLERTLSDYFYDTYFCSYTPLTLAAEKGNQSLAKFISNAKNNDFSSDKKETIHYVETRDTGNRIYWTTETTKVQQVSINEGVIGIAS